LKRGTPGEENPVKMMKKTLFNRRVFQEIIASKAAAVWGQIEISKGRLNREGQLEGKGEGN